MTHACNSERYLVSGFYKMKNPQNEIRKLLHRASPVRIATAFIFVFAMIPASIALRYYAVETILLDDAALAPSIAPGSWSLFCKLPNCKSNMRTGDFVLFKLHDGSQVVRQIIAKSGDQVKFTAAGFVSVNGNTPFQIENENIIIADREFSIPKPGETLVLDSLTDIEFDYALNYLKAKNIPFATDAKPYLGEEELPMDVAGNTRIGSRPTSIREIHGLPWQELYLISHQIRRNMRSTQNVYFKREAFHVEEYEVKVETKHKKDSTELPASTDTVSTDSTIVDTTLFDLPTDTKDTLAQKDSVEKEITEAQTNEPEETETTLKKEKRIGERIDTIQIEDEVFYVLAPHADHAADSRELGYIPKSQIIGKLLFKFDLAKIKALFK